MFPSIYLHQGRIQEKEDVDTYHVFFFQICILYEFRNLNHEKGYFAITPIDNPLNLKSKFLKSYHIV